MAGILVILIMVSFVGIFLSLIWPQKFIFGSNKKRSIGVLQYSVAFLIFVVIFGYIADESGSDKSLSNDSDIKTTTKNGVKTYVAIPYSEALAKDITKIRRSITNVNAYESTGVINVDLYTKDAWSEATLLRGFGLDIVDITKSFNNKLAKYDVYNKYNQIRFFAYTDTTDVYGNTYKSRVIALYYDLDDIQRINWDNFLTLNIFNLAKPTVSTPLQKDAAFKFCKKYKQDVTRFCSNVLK